MTTLSESFCGDGCLSLGLINWISNENLLWYKVVSILLDTISYFQSVIKSLTWS